MHLLLLGVALLAGVGVIHAAPPYYVTDVQELCQLPRPDVADNDGRVLGHDNGSSVRLGNTSYWFFADTVIDSNNNGAHDPSGDGFIGLGTVARTADLNAADGLSSFDYRDSGGTAVSFFPSTALHTDECLLWPLGSVVANNQIYVYSAGVKRVGGSCSLASPAEVFLARANPTTLAGTRLATLSAAGAPGFAGPFNVSEPDGCGGTTKYVYVTGTKPLPPVPDLGWPVQGYTLARVLEASIENPANYQYWNGSSWVANSSAASPLFEQVFGANAWNVAYNTYLGRWHAVYNCNFAQVCGRVANTAGSSPAALVGTWSDPVILFECPGDFLNCYLPYQHTEYGTGQTLYITASRNTPVSDACASNTECRCSADPAPTEVCDTVTDTCTQPTQARRYRLRLREVKLSTTVPSPAPVFVDAARQYSPRKRNPPDDCDAPQQGINGWTYRQLDGSTISNLAYNWLWSWIGTDSVSGFPGPVLSEDVGFPSNTKDALRVWTPPGAGTIRITGEARKVTNCGDGAIAEIVRIQGNTPVATLWSMSLTPAARSRLYSIATTVAAGDQIGFKVKRGGTVANCDEVFLAPTITFRP
jgi:hypothetical protein